MNTKLQHCEICQGLLIHRSDDKEETIKTRIKEYKPRLAQILEHYRSKHKLILINAEQTAEKVNWDIMEALGYIGLEK